MNEMNLRDDTATQPTLRLTRRFKARREAVFEAWTNPEALAAWFGPDGVQTRNFAIEACPGGRFSLEMYEEDGVYPVSGVYREISPPERIVLSWVWGHGELAGLETVVTIELREMEGGTELTLVHEGLPTDIARDKHEGGWIGCFTSLEQYLDRALGR